MAKKKMTKLKAGKAFRKALKAADRACSGKKASSKKCKTAMGRVYATKRHLTKYVGTM
jgi:hypothetical protein